MPCLSDWMVLVCGSTRTLGWTRMDSDGLGGTRLPDPLAPPAEPFPPELTVKDSYRYPGRTLHGFSSCSTNQFRA